MENEDSSRIILHLPRPCDVACNCCRLRATDIEMCDRDLWINNTRKQAKRENPTVIVTPQCDCIVLYATSKLYFKY